MGNDGGVVAVKRKFMRHANQKTKSEKVDQEVRRLERAQTCAVSGDPLHEPIVACALGNLYNKQALLERLLAKTVPERFQHISSLKDVVTCRFSTSGDGTFVCPITLAEFTGKQPFVVVWSCGCVVSERSMKEVSTKECLACGQAMEAAAVMALLPPEELYADAQQQLLERKAAEKRQKKESKKTTNDKKRSAIAAVDGGGSGNGESKRKDKKLKSERPRSHAADKPRSMATIAQEASAAMEQAKSTNKVFASLFSKEKGDKKSTASELLMTVSGMRYSLS